MQEELINLILDWDYEDWSLYGSDEVIPYCLLDAEG